MSIKLIEFKIYFLIKRLFDVVLSFLALILFFPIYISLVLLIRITIGKPVFFKQIRPGLHGKPFTIIKFRTMTNVYSNGGSILSDAERMTNFGRFLRSTSLDELPELWNVLKGDMSLVGPRPLLMEYLPLYSAEQKRRHLVRPGLTGWAQVNGRNAISWSDKFKLDIWYLDNQSFLLDIKILFLTAKRVCQRQGISADKNETMPRFTGNN
jgi:lipopolysaccharide/colanic/teichoic acid biosynthesis glycosyltransferase